MARILVVSDDESAREASVVALEPQEHEIFTTASQDGRRGMDSLVRSIEAFQPDVLVVDVEALFRATEGGTRVADALAAHQAAAGRGGASVAVAAPSILGLIAVGREEQIIPSFEAGADDYAQRPIEASELRFKIDLLLRAREKVGAAPATPPPADFASGTEPCELDPDASDSELPRNLGRYEIEGPLGRGGYGIVYRARDLARSRPVALKMLPRDMNGNSEAVARFFRESAAIARLDHPNIVKFYELGSWRGRFFFTMELVQGTTLKQVVEGEAPIDEQRAAAWIAQAANALAALASLGFVHRDIKPENMLVCPDGTLKLIDFGLVKIADTASITSQDDVLGTPYFMAPEYISAARRPDSRYDIYSLGVTFYNLLTGEYPFEGRNAAHVMEKHLREPAPRPSVVNPRVTLRADNVVLRMLEKTPEKRPQTPEELLLLLRPLLPPGI